MGPLFSKDAEVKDVTQIAEKFNDQFSSVFTTETWQIYRGRGATGSSGSIDPPLFQVPLAIGRPTPISGAGQDMKVMEKSLVAQPIAVGSPQAVEPVTDREALTLHKQGLVRHSQPPRRIQHWRPTWLKPREPTNFFQRKPHSWKNTQTINKLLTLHFCNSRHLLPMKESEFHLLHQCQTCQNRLQDGNRNGKDGSYITSRRYTSYVYDSAAEIRRSLQTAVRLDSYMHMQSARQPALQLTPYADDTRMTEPTTSELMHSATARAGYVDTDDFLKSASTLGSSDKENDSVESIYSKSDEGRASYISEL